MTQNANISPAPEKRAVTLYLIAGFKIFKGILLLVAAGWFFALAQKDLPEVFDKFLNWVHLDPENRFFAAISERLQTVTPGNVKTLASGTLIYGLFLSVSGLGLAFRVKWAVWLAIGESAFFIPIEIFELVRRHSPAAVVRAHGIFTHPKIGIAIVLALNVLIVWYLYVNRARIFRHHH
ncbi:MAG TPA: DUF2127 domain-containing protein [Verrucomicrobiae bacterium]|jgi:uncharacterized membrane protein (DUF2068 family)